MENEKEKEKEEKVEYEVEKINEKNIVLIAKSNKGIMRTSLFLWPKEIF